MLISILYDRLNIPIKAHILTYDARNEKRAAPLNMPDFTDNIIILIFVKALKICPYLLNYTTHEYII